MPSCQSPTAQSNIVDWRCVPHIRPLDFIFTMTLGALALKLIHACLSMSWGAEVFMRFVRGSQIIQEVSIQQICSRQINDCLNAANSILRRSALHLLKVRFTNDWPPKISTKACPASSTLSCNACVLAAMEDRQTQRVTVELEQIKWMGTPSSVGHSPSAPLWDRCGSSW